MNAGQLPRMLVASTYAAHSLAIIMALQFFSLSSSLVSPMHFVSFLQFHSPAGSDDILSSWLATPSRASLSGEWIFWDRVVPAAIGAPVNVALHKPGQVDARPSVTPSDDEGTKRNY